MPLYQFRNESIVSPIDLSFGSIKSLACCSTSAVNFLASGDCQRRTPMIATRTVFIGVNVKN